MKKFLLLLSCFLATWCSMQAGLKSSASGSEMFSAESRTMMNSAYAYGQSSGQIKSATYDKNSNTMFVTYSLSGASSAKLRLLQTRTGAIVGEYSLSVNANSTTFRVYTKSDIEHYGRYEYIDEGLYVLLLVVDGNVCSNMNVTITAKGKMNSFSPSLDNKKLTVNYTIEHASTYSITLRIDGTTQRISLPYPNTTSSYAFDSSSLTPGKTYTFRLYSGDNLLDTKKYTMPVPTGGLVVSYNPDNRYSFTVDYNLKYARKPTLCLYGQGGNLIKSMAISNSSKNKNLTINNWVEPNNYYTVGICENGVKTSIQQPLDTHVVTGTNNSITGITYEKGIDRILVQFSIKNPGANVAFKLISTRTGKSYDHIYGRCDQTSSNRYIDLPSDDNGYHGSIIYVVLLMVNDQIVDSKQIMVAR